MQDIRIHVTEYEKVEQAEERGCSVIGLVIFQLLMNLLSFFLVIFFFFLYLLHLKVLHRISMFHDYTLMSFKHNVIFTIFGLLTRSVLFTFDETLCWLLCPGIIAESSQKSKLFGKKINVLYISKLHSKRWQNDVKTYLPICKGTPSNSHVGN